MQGLLAKVAEIVAGQQGTEKGNKDRARTQTPLEHPPPPHECWGRAVCSSRPGPLHTSCHRICGYFLF